MENEKSPNPISSIDSTRNEAATKSKHNLTTIPPELRLLIYEICFSTFHFDSSKPQPGILYTCKIIHQEALKPYEARIMAVKDEERTNQQQANTSLQRRLDSPSIGLAERLSLQLAHMKLELERFNISTDLEFEHAKVHRLQFGSWFKQPRRKASVSYMKGVVIPK